MELPHLKRYALEQKGRLKQLQEERKLAKHRKREAQRILKHQQNAQKLIELTARETQESLVFKVSQIATQALQMLFSDDFELDINLQFKRRQIEAEIYLLDKDNNKIDPMTACGGGLVDVVSLALRVSLWTMQKDKLRNTIVMDEPFKYLSHDKRPKMYELLRELSKRFNLQFIIVTHDQVLAESADTLFKVSISGGISDVEKEEI